MRKIRAMVPANSEDMSSFKGLLKRATTEMLVLLSLKRRPMYTYEIMNELEQMSGGYLSFNTLYIAIHRLKELRFVEETSRSITDGNRMRVYFSITAVGLEYLENLVSEYRRFSDIINDMIKRE